MEYAELHCHSYFSLLDGASSPESLVARAKELGLAAIALTDHDSLAGAVRFWKAAQTAALHAVIGAELTLDDGTHLTLLAENQRGYSNLCRLLTLSHIGTLGENPPLLPVETTELTTSSDLPVEAPEVTTSSHLSVEATELTTSSDDDLRPWSGKTSPVLPLSALATHHAGLLALLTPNSALASVRPAPASARPAPASARATPLLYRDSTASRRGVLPGVEAGIEHGSAPQLAPQVEAWIPECLREIFGKDHLFLELQHHRGPHDDHRIRAALALARRLDLSCVATNDVHYATAREARLHHALIAIRHNQSLTAARRAGHLPLNNNYELTAPDVMARRFAAIPAAVRATVELARRCSVSLDFSQRRLPVFQVPGGRTEFTYLYELCHAGLPRRYPRLSPPVLKQLAHELSVIEQAGLAGYFLTVWDIVRFAREHEIRCQGRGSAANSLVAYLLGITSVDPLAHNLLFERFLSSDRFTIPDIDLDFAADRREEVIQYVYNRYGASHAAMVCNVVTYRARSAVRDLGKALDFPLPVIDRLAKTLDTHSCVKAAAELLQQIESPHQQPSSLPHGDPEALKSATAHQEPSSLPHSGPDGRKPPTQHEPLSLHGVAKGIESAAAQQQNTSSLPHGGAEGLEPPAQQRQASSLPHGVAKGIESTHQQQALSLLHDGAESLEPSTHQEPSSLPRCGAEGIEPASGQQLTASLHGGAKGIESAAAHQEPSSLPHDADGIESTAGQHLLRLLAELLVMIDECPRHLSIHTGGMLITGPPLDEVVPLERATMPGRVVCQWNKDSVEDAGLIKIDLLGLRTLGLISEALSYVKTAHPAQADPDLEQLPLDDPELFAMLQRADTIGAFQVESRAQQQMLPRLKPECFADIVIEVAIVRPGPIQGGAVHPYLRRRSGAESISYLHPCLEPVLRETLGVLLFQEQAIRVAMVAANFSPGEADMLRRAMSRARSVDAMAAVRERFISGAQTNGIDCDTAGAIFHQLEGFAGFGFCKSHAASFALIAWQTLYLKRYYPAEFYCALLNQQPMGFYSAEVIIGDAKRHGITLLPPDINHSHWLYTLEPSSPRVNTHSSSPRTGSPSRADTHSSSALPRGVPHEAPSPHSSIAESALPARPRGIPRRVPREAPSPNSSIGEEPPALLHGVQGEVPSSHTRISEGDLPALPHRVPHGAPHEVLSLHSRGNEGKLPDLPHGISGEAPSPNNKVSAVEVPAFPRRVPREAPSPQDTNSADELPSLPHGVQGEGTSPQDTDSVDELPALPHRVPREVPSPHSRIGEGELPALPHGVRGEAPSPQSSVGEGELPALPCRVRGEVPSPRERIVLPPSPAGRGAGGEGELPGIPAPSTPARGLGRDHLSPQKISLLPSPAGRGVGGEGELLRRSALPSRVGSGESETLPEVRIVFLPSPSGRGAGGEGELPHLRMGLRSISGLGESTWDRIRAARASQQEASSLPHGSVHGGEPCAARGVRGSPPRPSPFTTLHDFCVRTTLPQSTIADLIRAGALDALGERRALLWQLGDIDYRPDELPLVMPTLAVDLPALEALTKTEWEYELLGLSPHVQLMHHYRAALNRAGILSTVEVKQQPNGRAIRVGGMVAVKQRPPTAKGIVFISLEDELGMLDLVVKPQVYERYRSLLRGRTFILVAGEVQRSGQPKATRLPRGTAGNRQPPVADAVSVLVTQAIEFHPV